MINIFNYKSYRQYLNDIIANKKNEDENFSISKLSKSLGLSHTSSINKVLRGQRNPGKDLIEKITVYLNFTPDEESFFRDLIHLEKEENLIQKNKILTRIDSRAMRTAKNEFEHVEFEKISNWYHHAILEIIRLKDFIYDCDWISARLGKKINADQVRNSVNTLKKLRIIEEVNGELEISMQSFETPTDIPSEDIKKYHEECILLGRDSIRDVSVESRYVSSSTIAVKKDSLEEVKRLIDQFQDNLSHLIEAKSDADDVYVLNIQYFPVTK